MSEYTAEEYREVLKAIYDMNCIERRTVFGESRATLDYVFNNSAQEIIEKYRAYINTPKTGEYWKANDGQVVVVRYIKNDLVYYYYCDCGTSNHTLARNFVRNFTKTGYKSKYLEDFLSEMEEVSGTE